MALEIRKLQKIKGGSFTLSLPKQWVEERKLKSGEQIAVSLEEDGSLRIFPVSEAVERPLEVTLSLDNYSTPAVLEYSVATYYVQGVNLIKIISQNTMSAEQKRRLKQLRTELPGVEVAEEEANCLCLQVLIDPATFLLESLIERTSAFSLKLQEDAIRSLVAWNFPLAKEVQERSQEARRQYRVMIRQVALASMNRKIAEKIGVRNCQELITFALVARDLSRLVYHSSSIARHVLRLENKKKITSNILEKIEGMSGTVFEMQKNATEAYLKKNARLAIEVFSKMPRIREKEEVLLKGTMEKIQDVNMAITLSMIARDLRRIAGYAVAVADDAMNRVLTPTDHRKTA